MTDSSDKPQLVHCPTCRKTVEWTSQAKWKPFCSERCSLIDLGEWLEEKPRIAGNPYLPEEDEH